MVNTEVTEDEVYLSRVNTEIPNWSEDLNDTTKRDVDIKRLLGSKCPTGLQRRFLVSLLKVQGMDDLDFGFH